MCAWLYSCEELPDFAQAVLYAILSLLTRLIARASGHTFLNTDVSLRTSSEALSQLP